MPLRCKLLLLRPNDLLTLDLYTLYTIEIELVFDILLCSLLAPFSTAGG